MARHRRLVRAIDPLPAWRRGLLLVVATAFLLQGYVTQTHIHRGVEFGGIASLGLDSGKAAANNAVADKRGERGKLPGSDDPAKCPLCQAVGFAGQFVWPNAVVFVLPTQAASVVAAAVIVFVAPQIDSHNWQGRAPPR
jgi:hypothetical protein